MRDEILLVALIDVVVFGAAYMGYRIGRRHRHEIEVPCLRPGERIRFRSEGGDVDMVTVSISQSYPGEMRVDLVDIETWAARYTV